MNPWALGAASLARIASRNAKRRDWDIELFPNLWLGFSDFNRLLLPHSSLLPTAPLLLLLLFTPIYTRPAKPLYLHPSASPLC